MHDQSSFVFALCFLSEGKKKTSSGNFKHCFLRPRNDDCFWLMIEILVNVYSWYLSNEVNRVKIKSRDNCEMLLARSDVNSRLNSK